MGRDRGLSMPSEWLGKYGSGFRVQGLGFLVGSGLRVKHPQYDFFEPNLFLSSLPPAFHRHATLQKSD